MEIMVAGKAAHVIRQREKIADLYALERLLPAASAPSVKSVMEKEGINNIASRSRTC
jgi:hypothetical protein